MLQNKLGPFGPYLALGAVALAALLISACGSGAAPEAVATPVPDQPVTPDTLALPINIQGANKLGSLEFVLTYDAAVLELVTVEQGDLGGNALLEFSDDASGKVWVGMVDANGIKGDGSVVVATFKPKSTDKTTSLFAIEDVEAYHADSFVDFLATATEGNYAVADGGFTAPTIELKQ